MAKRLDTLESVAKLANFGSMVVQRFQGRWSASWHHGDAHVTAKGETLRQLIDAMQQPTQNPGELEPRGGE